MEQPTRRGMIVTFVGAVLAELLARGQTHTPQPMPSPNAPRNQNVPAGLDGADIPWNNKQDLIPPATWLEIKSESRKLLDMTTDFKNRVDRTNVSAKLPLPLIKQAHEIEKLAKKIQKQMKS